MKIQALELMISTGLLILIWLIQILHYPSFRFIDQRDFPRFAKFHGSRISMIVIPLMFMELGLALFFCNPVILTLVTGIWLSTFLLQVPCHNLLGLKHDPLIIDRLITTNWVRTTLWTIKYVILTGWFFASWA